MACQEFTSQRETAARSPELARLERKGLVRRQQEGIRHLYSATVSPRVEQRSVFQQYLQTFFAGSRRLKLTSLLQ